VISTRLPVSGPEHRLGGGGDLQRLGHAAGAAFAALGHLARIGADHRDAVGGELRQVAAGRRVGPHARVHRRGDQHRPVGREQHRGGEVVGVAARHLGHEVGGRRRDHDQVGVAREPDMADVELGAGVEQVGMDALACDRAGRQRRDEFLRGARHHDARGRAALLQASDQVERFVGRDAAADDEKDAFAGKPDRIWGRRAGIPDLGAARRQLDCAPRMFRRRRRSRAGREMLREEVPGLFFHRAAVTRRAQAQAPFDVVVELADREAGHRAVLLEDTSIAHDCIAINAIMKP
jgi:hypothetical protein